MHANLLMVDHQNTIPSRKPDHSKGLGKGLIEEDQERGRGERDFSSTLVEVENEQRSHPGPVDESSVERKESETEEVKSEDLRKDASGGTESEDVEEDANMGLVKAGNASRPFLVLEGKAGAGSESGHVVEGEELPSKLKVIKKAVPSPNQADQTLSIDPDKANASRMDPTGLGLERKQGESEGEKVAATTPRVVEKLEKPDSLLRGMSETGEPKGKETSEVRANPQGVEKREKPDGLLRGMSVTGEPKGKETSEVRANPQGVEKREKPDGLLRGMSETGEPKGKETSEVKVNPQGIEKTEKRDGLLRGMSETGEPKGKETSEVRANPQGVEKREKRDGLLRGMSETGETKGKETSEVKVNPQGIKKTEKRDGLLRGMSVTAETKGKETSEVRANPQGVEKREKPDGLLRGMSVTAETKGKETSEAAATPRGFEKAGNPLMDLKEELGRINRDVNDKDPAAQKLRMGSGKGPSEESVQKDSGIEASAPRLGLGPKDAGSETAKVKVSAGDLTHKKVEKAEPGNGENSNLSSRNFSTPDKGAGAISQPKEPQAFTKSAQTDTLKQIVNKAALNVGNGRSEFKIDLKPESLGHLKMQILTENNQVTVRILAENPLVKDMIESNLAQLKANFQNQGLEIEKFDVSVARDSDQNGTGDGRYGSRKMRAKSGDPKNGYDGKLEEPEEIDARARRGQGEGAVNFFA